MKLLIADDEPVIVRGLMKLLPWKELGFTKVLEAYCGEQARALLVKERPPVMVSDIAMPDLTGIDLLRLIKAEGLFTQVILLSGHKNFAFARDALALGAVDYLLKPVNTQELQAAVEKARAVVLEKQESAAFQAHFADPPQWLDTLAAQDGGRDVMLDTQYTVATEKAYAVICGELQLAEDVPLEKRELMRFGAYSKADAWATAQGAIPFRKNGFFAAIVQADEAGGCLAYAQTVSDGICARVRQETGLHMTLCASPAVHAMRDIRQAYEKAQTLLTARTPCSEEDTLAEKVKRYLAEHCTENITLEAAAAVACMSASYFSAFFKKQTGFGFKEYLTRMRLEEAKRLMRRTDLKIYEVASRVGFGDPKHFTDMFRKYAGMTPQQFKESL